MLPTLIETEVALGVIPLGTGNVWARELGLPLDPRRAISRQLARPPRPVDLGRANGRLFLTIASVGFDAHIVRMVESGSKTLGQIAYPLAGVSLAGTLRGTLCRVRINGEPPKQLALLAGIVTNGRLYGGLVPLFPESRLDDGLLDLVLFAGHGPVDAAAHTARVLAGVHLSDPNVTVRRISRLTIEADQAAVPYQADGDPRGTTPLEVEVIPAALLALGVPARTASGPG